MIVITMWVQNSAVLQELQELFATEPSLQPCFGLLLFFVILKLLVDPCVVKTEDRDLTWNNGTVLLNWCSVTMKT